MCLLSGAIQLFINIYVRIFYWVIQATNLSLHITFKISDRGM